MLFRSQKNKFLKVVRTLGSDKENPNNIFKHPDIAIRRMSQSPNLWIIVPLVHWFTICLKSIGWGWIRGK